MYMGFSPITASEMWGKRFVNHVGCQGWEGVIWEGELKELTSEEIRNPKQEYQSPPKRKPAISHS